MPPQQVGAVEGGFEPESPGVKRTESHETIKFDDALELVGFGRVQVELIVICGVTIMATICETMGISVILPAAKCDLPMSTGNQGLLSGATFLGIMVSSYLWGYLSDTRGRRRMMRYGLYVSAVCAVVSSFANDFSSLLALRLMAGVCISAPSATVFPYLGEFCMPSKRAQTIAFASISAMLTMAYIALIGWWILSYDWTIELGKSYFYKPWRLLFVLYTLPGLVAATAFRFVPESPKFYLAVGRPDRALDVLRYCHRKNRGSPSGFTELRLEPESEASNRKLGLWASLRQQTMPLLKWPLVLYFAVCCLQQISAFAVYGGLGLWYPELMNQAKENQSICTVVKNAQMIKIAQNLTTSENCVAQVHDQTFVSILILAAFGTIFSIIIAILLGKVNQKKMVMVNFVVAASAGVVLLFTTNRYLMVVLFCTEVTLAGFTMVLVNGTAVSIFPTHIRAMAVSLSMMMARLSSFTFSSLIGYIMEDNCEATFCMFSGILILGASLTVLLPR